MIWLLAQDPEITLTEEQVQRVKSWLLEFIPAVHVHVWSGPGVAIQVPDHHPDELAPGILAEVERVVGCQIAVTGELGDPTPCPACGAGPEKATDSERMWASVCYCGHPRYYDYKHIDGTCPCLRP